ncbi:PAN domain-containing protein [Sulfitobacter sp. 1A16787]|uniref:PAN domain-containing protein n=1 Tax=Sulfitobacter sp. 1A16787 TaxID=3368571 RepID=UPI003744B4D3
MLLRLLLSASLALAALPATGMEIIGHLDTPGAPLPNRLYLKMTGDIVAGDAEKLSEGLKHYDSVALRELVIYLDSPGGSLVEGLKIARILQSRPEIVKTRVGETDTAASCASACVILFAAGDLRDLADTGRIGVHQFYSSKADLSGADGISLGQSLSSDLIGFLESQGVSSALFKEMAYTPAETMSWVDSPQLEAWGLVTGDVIDQSMEYVNINGELWLKLEHRSLYGDNMIALSCNQRHEVVGVANLDQPPKVVAGDFYVVIDGVPVIPAASRATSNEKHRTKVTFKLEAYQARLLAGAGSFGARVMDSIGDGFWGFQYSVEDKKLREMINGCGGGNFVQPGLRTEPGIDLYGADLYRNGIRNVTLQTCVQACKDDRRCVGVSYVEAKKWCWPKSSARGRRQAPGITSVIKP